MKGGEKMLGFRMDQVGDDVGRFRRVYYGDVTIDLLQLRGAKGWQALLSERFFDLSFLDAAVTLTPRSTGVSLNGEVLTVGEPCVLPSEGIISVHDLDFRFRLFQPER